MRIITRSKAENATWRHGATNNPENAQEQKRRKRRCTATHVCMALHDLRGISNTLYELPDDIVCPVCGVGKELFERIELRA